MIFRKFQNMNLSLMGMGCMRLPVKDGDDSRIDEKAAGKMVDEAVKAGVNYFDTAWGYHEGASETFIGRALKKYPRESFYLATKFPGYDLTNFGKAEEIFEEQLKKCQVDYFDFYLIHNVCELNIEQYLDREKYGTVEFLLEQKKKGRIRHLGFSDHSGTDVMKRFLEAYGQYMEFCQIQLNWLDWKFQKAEEKVEILKKLGIPVWVMEPVRGGKLIRLAEEEKKRLMKIRPGRSVADWSYRFLQGIPEVTVILSGSSDMKQLKENLKSFEEEDSLTSAQIQILYDMAEKMTGEGSVPCTACRYCTSHCPRGLDIPGLISLYNEHCFTSRAGLFAFIAPMAIGSMEEMKKPSACTGCGSCEAVCPQKLKIPEIMKDFSKRLQ